MSRGADRGRIGSKGEPPLKRRVRRSKRTKRPRRDRASASLAATTPGEGVASSLRGGARRLFQVTPRHLQLLAELDRLFPDQAPIVDLRALGPGTESIETISDALLRSMLQRLERPVFLAFGEINSERLIDFIEEQLEAGAWSLDPHEIYAETLYRLFERLQKRGEPGDGILDGAARVPRRSTSRTEKTLIAPEQSIFDMLAESSERVIQEQVEWLTASTLPLPGLAAPRAPPPAKVLERGRKWIASESVVLGEAESERLVAHALLTLPKLQRRLIHLRDQRGLDAQEIAQRLDLRPFEALLQLKRAELALHDRIREIILRFLGGPPQTAAEETTEPRPGKLLRLRSEPSAVTDASNDDKRGRGKGRSDKEEDHDLHD
jgi:DNA-directed RNA polymerase specialized sigma24 family protein